MSNEISPVQKSKNLIAAMGPEFAKVLPKVLTPDRFCRVVLSAINKNPTLAQALSDPKNQASALAAFMKAAESGLEPDGRRATINCYKKSNGGYDITFIPMYQGLCELAMRSGQISNIHADKVCENDDFKWDTGKISHTINFKEPRGKVYAYYCVVTFKDGSTKTETMSLDEVNQIKARSSSVKFSKSGPWFTDFDEMAKKGLACNTPIFANGEWKNMEDIQKGDVVIDMNGCPTDVIAVSEIKHLPCYEVEFSNGEKIVCDNEHRWVCGIGSNAAREMKTYEIKEMFDAHKSGKGISIPVTKPIETKLAVACDTNPYILGYWIGNGAYDRASVTCHADDCDDICKAIQLSVYTLGKVVKDNRSNSVTVGIKNGFKEYLVNAGFYKNKHIPADVILWSKQDRIAFVRGLMDSDGCIEKNRGRAIFATTDKKIAEDFFSLIHSLGEFANISRSLCNGFGKKVDCYRVQWMPSVFIPVSTKRKMANCKQRKFKNYRSVKSIKEVESVPTKCIAVSSSTHTYLAGKTFVPTHNTVFRRCSKWLPLSPEQQKAFEFDNEDFSAEINSAVEHAINDKFNQALAEQAPAIPENIAIDAEVVTEAPEEALFEGEK